MWDVCGDYDCVIAVVVKRCLLRLCQFVVRNSLGSPSKLVETVLEFFFHLETTVSYSVVGTYLSFWHTGIY